MYTESNPLTPHQQVINEYRERYSERLRVEGSSISHYGSLLLSDIQLELVQATGEPLPPFAHNASELQRDKSGREKWLTTPINDIPFFTFDRSQTRTVYELKYNGLATIRDVLIFGQAQTGRVHHIGIGTIQALLDHFRDSPYGIVWAERPTPSDISEVSSSLDDVKLRLVRPVFDRALFFMPKGFRSAEQLGANMPDLLSMPYQDLAKKYADSQHFNGNARAKTLDMAERVQSRATAFAREFYNAR